MSDIYPQFKAAGLEILFAAVNTNPDVQGFVQRFGVPFPVGVGENDKAREFMQFTMVSMAYVPWLVVVDRKGMIRAQFTGNDAFFNGGQEAVKRVIAPLLAEKAEAPPRKT